MASCGQPRLPQRIPALQHRPSGSRDAHRLPACFLLFLLQGERRIRGTGLYSAAAMFNHECLPSVARFDRFNASAAGPGSSAAAPGTNTAVEFRALHDIPEGGRVPVGCTGRLF